MLSTDQLTVLRHRTCQLLWDVGMKVDSDAITAAMLKRGCKEAPWGRIRIPTTLIDEMTVVQKKTQSQDDDDQQLHYTCNIDWAHHIIWNGQQNVMKKRLKSHLLMSAFDCGPTTYYDYKQQKALPIDTKTFIEIMKLAEATPEIGYISTWCRQDVPQEIERIDSLLLGLKHTRKVDGIEAISPDVIKYLKDISEIVTDRPGDSSYLAGSECITSPLILGERSAEDILERARRGIHRYHVASMPTTGFSTPVTPAGAIVMTAAEILGGMAACFAVDPESDLSGRSIVLVADMRNANSTCTSEIQTLVNLGVKELFDTWWGGHLWVDVFFSPHAQRPGLQAVYENFFGQWRTSKILVMTDIPYPGVGTLDNGGMGSATQLMLDMEIRKSQFAMADKIAVDPETLPFDEISAAVRENKDFLTSDHTLQHFREVWASKLFLTDAPDPNGWAGDEKAILDMCDDMWRENVKRFEPPQWPAEKIKAFDDVLTRARKEFGFA